MISSGLLIRAWARPIRRVMPLEYSRTAGAWPRQPDHVDQVGGPLPADRPGHVEQPAVEVQRLLGVEEAVEVRLLGQVADPLVLGDFGGLAAEDQGSPLVGNSSPRRSLIVVVLPEPFGPSRPKISPWRTSRSRALRARTFCRPQKSR